MTKEQEELEQLILQAVKADNVAFLQQADTQEYLNQNPKFLRIATWEAAENNFLKSERFLKLAYLRHFHPDLSMLAFKIAAGERTENLDIYSKKDLIEALEIARFTKQDGEIRVKIRTMLSDKFADDIRFSSNNAIDIQDKYMGHSPPFSSRSLASNVCLVLGSLMVLAGAAIFIAGTAGAGFIGMVAMFTMALPIGTGVVLFVFGFVMRHTPAITCSDNILNFIIEPARIVSNPNYTKKGSISDLSETFKIPAEAEANIKALEEMSPGLVNHLKQHFLQRIEVAEDYAKTLDKDRESGIIDTSEIKKLESDWHKIIESAAKGTESFCLEVRKYLEYFEAGQHAAANLGPYAEDKKSTLTFASIDKKITAHINKIATKANLKM